MLLIVPLLIITVLISANMLSVTPTKTQNINGVATSPSITSVLPSQTTVQETITPDPSVNVEITNVPSIQQNTDTNFVYPNSQSLGGGVYESSDNPNAVTSWYKEKIKSENMNATSFVTTNTNDNVKNVLAAENGITNISVEITKNAGDSKTVIKIK